MLKQKLACLICIIFPIPVFASAIYNTLPEEVSPDNKYIFYSHGYIVEGDDPKPKHPRWGVYDYPAILNALSATKATIVAEHRAANSDPFAHARKLKQQVLNLLKQNVPAKNITLIGFSRGGFITGVASSLLANDGINYVILAACTSGLANREEIQLHGHILSIYETSDSVGSCKGIVGRNPETVASFQEIAISTGKEHGAFYQPLTDWVEPLTSWIALSQEEKK